MSRFKTLKTYHKNGNYPNLLTFPGQGEILKNQKGDSPLFDVAEGFEFFDLLGSQCFFDVLYPDIHQLLLHIHPIGQPAPQVVRRDRAPGDKICPFLRVCVEIIELIFPNIICPLFPGMNQFPRPIDYGLHAQVGACFQKDLLVDG